MYPLKFSDAHIIEKRGVRTQNKMGYMLLEPDEYIREFINFSRIRKGHFLEIGAAYGLASLKVIENGVKISVNDLDAQHLQVLQASLNPSLLKNLDLKPGRFPHELYFPSCSLDGILASQVFHFLSEQDICEGMINIYKWLKPGGKIFITVSTPYMSVFKDFIPIFQHKKSVGHEFPGFINDVALYDPSRADNLPPTMNLFDEDVLEKMLVKHGFCVEKKSNYARPTFPVELQLDGREVAGIIGVRV